MIDRRKRKVGQVWKLDVYDPVYDQENRNLPPGFYSIISLDNSENPKATIIRFKDLYGEDFSNERLRQYVISRKKISTVRGWQFESTKGPEFIPKPQVCYCRTCGRNATVIESVIPVTNYHCDNCRPRA